MHRLTQEQEPILKFFVSLHGGLEELWLRQEEIGVASVSTLVVSQSKWLRKIRLGFLEFEKDSTCKLAACLGGCEFLNTINLRSSRWNFSYEDVISIFASHLACSTSLRYFGIDLIRADRPETADFDALCIALEKNTS